MKISIIAHPNSKKPRIEKDLLDTLHVYVHEPPLEGRANKAIEVSFCYPVKNQKPNFLRLLRNS